jgi:hypothetical protein
MSSRNMSLLPRATLHSDSEHLLLCLLLHSLPLILVLSFFLALNSFPLILIMRTFLWSPELRLSSCNSGKLCPPDPSTERLHPEASTELFFDPRLLSPFLIIRVQYSYLLSSFLIIWVLYSYLLNSFLIILVLYSYLLSSFLIIQVIYSYLLSSFLII